MSATMSLLEMAEHMHDLQKSGMGNSDEFSQAWDNFYVAKKDASLHAREAAQKYIEENGVFHNEASVFMEHFIF